MFAQLLLILQNWKVYRYWKKRKRGVKTIDRIKGPGYYFPTGLVYYNHRGKVEEWQMESGRIGLHELIDYRCYSDPDDMIKESAWHFIGYKDMKPIKECTFAEFLNLYCFKPITQ